MGGQLDGIVTDIGITYVKFDTGGSVMSVPNSQVLNAMVGPIPVEANGDGQGDAVAANDGRKGPAAVSDGKSGTPGGPEQQQPSPPGPA